MFQGYLRVLGRPEQDLTEEVKNLKRLEDDADVLTHDITEYLVRTSAAEISPENARAVSRMVRIASELEEISDVIYRLVQITARKYRKERAFGEQASLNVSDLAATVVEMIDFYEAVLKSGHASEDDVARAEAMEVKTDRLRKQYNKASMERMSAAESSVKTEMITVDLHNQFELIGNYALSVVKNAHFLGREDESSDEE